MTRHLLVAISPHGLGHAMPTVAVLNALRHVLPELSLTLMTRLPRAAFVERLQGPFEIIDHGAEFGMHMDGPLDVKVQASAEGYAALIEDWDNLVAQEADVIRRATPDLVLSNISFLAIAGAKAAGVPVAALCSFNWLDVFGAYCGDLTGAPAIMEHLQGAYAGADIFLRASPGTAMDELTNTRVIGPIGSVGTARRDAIDKELQLSSSQRLVIADLGGIAGGDLADRLPVVDKVHWLLPGAVPDQRADISSTSTPAMPYIDVLASADAVVTKPGYGTFIEAAANATRVLYAARGVWPEEPHMCPWINDQACAAEISRSSLEGGTFVDDLQALLARRMATAVSPAGNEQAAKVLRKMLEV